MNATTKIPPTIDLYETFAAAHQRLKPRQRQFVHLYLHGETAGNAAASARAAGYGGKYAEKDIYRLLPRPGFDPDLTRDSSRPHSLTLAIWYGLQIQRQETRKVEEGRSAERVSLGITSDFISGALKEIVERCMGREWNPETGESDPNTFNPKHFHPGPALRALELLGRNLGMFSERVRPTTHYDDMTGDELDAEIARLDARIAELQFVEKSIDRGSWKNSSRNNGKL